MLKHFIVWAAGATASAGETLDAIVYVEFVISNDMSVLPNESSMVIEFVVNECDYQIVKNVTVQAFDFGYSWRYVDGVEIVKTVQSDRSLICPDFVRDVDLSSISSGVVIGQRFENGGINNRNKIKEYEIKYSDYLAPRCLPVYWSSVPGIVEEGIIFGTVVRRDGESGLMFGAGRRAYFAHGKRLPPGTWDVWLTATLPVGPAIAR
jgi:hypothetical protein